MSTFAALEDWGTAVSMSSTWTSRIAMAAYSPVTGVCYKMQCAPGFIAHLNYGPVVPSVRCVGGNNAVVIVF